MQGLQVALEKTRKALNYYIGEMEKKGKDKAESERLYRVEKAKMILKYRMEKMAVTLISDLVRGDPYVADLKMRKETAATSYDVTLQRIYQCKTEIEIIKYNMSAVRKGE